MNYILGVDAGNTKTIALVAHRDGRIVGVGRSGCGDIYAAALGDDIPAVQEAVTTALATCDADPDQIAAGGFNMAGADYPEDYAFIEAAIRRYGYGQTFTVVNDAIGPLWAATNDGTGVAVTCGTGAATGARASDGQFWHSSFWQDPMGGHELGEKALKAVYQAELGIAPPTVLTKRVLEFFGETEVERLLHRHTARGTHHRQHIRHLVRLLFDTAEDGDAVAQAIVQQHGAGLGAIALVAARKVGIQHTPFTLVLAGGVLRHPSRLLADALVEQVRAEAPNVQVVQSRFEPVIGALLMGMHAAGIEPDDSIRARIAETMPGQDFFKSDL